MTTQQEHRENKQTQPFIWGKLGKDEGYVKWLPFPREGNFY